MSNAISTLGQCLVHTVLDRPDAGITFIDRHGARDFTSYAQLRERAFTELGRLQAAGVAPGSIVLLQLGSTRRYMETLWACILGRYISVNVAHAPSYAERNSVTDKLYNVWRSLGQPNIVTDSERAPELNSAFSLYATEPPPLLIVDRLAEVGPGQVRQAEARDVAVLQLSSGSTGIPKAIQLTHGGILAHIRSARAHNGHCRDDVTFNWMAMDHVGALVTYHFKDTVLGCHQIHAEMDWILGDPLRWLDTIHEHRVTHSWSPNFGYRLLCDAYAKRQGRAKSWDLSCVRKLMNGGEQVTLPVLRRLLEDFAPFGLASDAPQPAFGMAECCTCVTYNNDFSVDRAELRVAVSGIGSKLAEHGIAEKAFVDLGPVVPGLAIRIADAANSPLGDDVVGRLQIRGNAVTPGYLHHPAANAESFVGDGWFNSGDLGFLHQGRLFLVGREKETLVIRGANLFCYELEEFVGSRSGVAATFVAATSVRDEAEGTERLVLFFVPDSYYLAGRTEADIRQAVSAAFGVAAEVVIAVPRAEFAKTTSGKIQRGEMNAKYLAGELGPKLASEPIATRVWAPTPVAPRAARRLDSLHAIVFSTADASAAALPFGKLTLVEVSECFARTERGYQVAPTSEADFAALFDAVGRERRNEHGLALIFAWDFGDEERWLAAAVGLMRALARSGLAIAELWVVADHVLRTGSDAAVLVQAEAAVAFMQAGSLELPGVQFRCLDLAGCAQPLRLRTLVAELCNDAAEHEIAYREGVRWVSSTQETWLDNSVLFESTALPLATGWVLVSGGTGGLGRILVADILRASPDIHVLIVARGEHSLEQAAWPELTTSELARLAHQRADFSETDTVLGALAAHGVSELTAVFHLAGTFHGASIADESEPALRALHHAKTFAAGTLEALAQRFPQCTIIGCSSVVSHVGLPRMAAYCSANRGLEAVIARLASRGVRAVSVLLGPFAGVGMNADPQGNAALEARGFRLLQPQQLWQALQLACAHPRQQLLFGAPRATVRARTNEAGSTSHAEADANAGLDALIRAFAETCGRELDRTHAQRTLFELGADSLKLTRFRQRLETDYGIDVPMSALYRLNTLERLYRELIQPRAQHATPAPSAGTLIKLRSGTSSEQAALLLIPPAGGVLAPYEKLLAALPSDRAVWGFEDPYVHGPTAEWSLASLIEDWAARVEQTFATAPVIVGYSAAGYAAWALTEALNQRGFAPPLLVLVDTYLVGRPNLLSAAMHHMALATDNRAAGLMLRAVFHGLQTLQVPVPVAAHEAWASSALFRNGILRCLFETQRLHQGWPDEWGDTALPSDFHAALDSVCEIALRCDPRFDVTRFRLICTHAAVFHPRRMVSCKPGPLANKLALFEVDKQGLTVRELIGKHAQRLVASEQIEVKSYAEVRKRYFGFSESAALTKHYICMYDEHFVESLARRLTGLLATLES